MKSILIFILELATVWAAPKDFPTKFNDLPSSFFYFKDSSVIMLQDGDEFWRSSDEGKTYTKLDQLPVKPSRLLNHPYDKSVVCVLAFVFGQKEHIITYDKGAHWEKFTTPYPISDSFSLSFHEKDPKRVIIQLSNCDSTCRQDAYYTLDSFKSVSLLLPWTSQCEWAQNIDPTLKSIDTKVFCTQWPKEEQKGDTTYKDPNLLQLMASSDFFKDGVLTSVSIGGVPVIGITENWLVAVVKLTDGYHMSICKDGTNFVKSKFSYYESSEYVSPMGYSILESSKQSLVVDIITAIPGSHIPNPFGNIYVSNSDGTYFVKSLEYVNRDMGSGLIDFERIQSSIYEGVLLSNTVRNWKDVLNHNTLNKELQTYMSFDNGRRWNRISPPSVDGSGKKYSCSGDDCTLHLHSVSTSKNIGRVFSVSSAPGIIIGVGSVGAYLLPYAECDTFLSDDSGITWKAIQQGPHKYEVINFGSTLVLIPDGDQAYSHILYSKDLGKNWETIQLKIEGSSWVPLFTTLDAESYSQNMIISLAKEKKSGQKYLVQLNFEDIFNRKCSTSLSSSNSDLELWNPKSPNGKCVLGGTSSYYRRKQNADCAIDKKFAQQKPIETSCECSDFDYECDIGYKPDLKKTSLVCTLIGQVRDQPLDCKVGSKYLGSSGYRLLPGDKCKGGDDKRAEKVTRECQRLPGSNKPAEDPVSRASTFPSHVSEILEVRSTNATIVLTEEGIVWVSTDQGGSWKKLGFNEPVLKIVPHDTIDKRLFLFTDDKIFISNDGLMKGADGLAELKTPEPYNVLGIPVIDFHPTEPEWYTFVSGGRDCLSKTCFSKAFFTKDGGKVFNQIDTWTNKCIWARDVDFQDKSLAVDSIFCASFKQKGGSIGQDRLQPTADNPVHLVLIENNGKSVKTILDRNVLDYYVIENIMLVATNDVTNPVLYSSVNGQTFAEVKFPPAISLEKTSFTVLGSNTNGIFLDIAQTSKFGHEYGILFKSNSNGEFFSRVLDHTNRGTNGKVDFQKFPGVDGVAIANVIASSGTQEKKIITSIISFDDGSMWTDLRAPEVDSNNEPLTCKNKPCKLHLHFQSDDDGIHGMMQPYGNAGTAGLMIGVGNVGESLLEYDLGDVFITRDAGKTWSEVRKDAHIWTIADYGGLLVLVNDEKSTNVLTYSWDFGLSWADYTFTEKPIRVESLMAHQDSNKVLIMGHHKSFLGSESETVSIQIDFSSLFKRTCDRSKSSSDFEEWQPANPLKKDSKCFMGETKTFLRRKPDSICTIGPGFDHIVPNSTPCSCDDEDFECDYNFFRDDSGKCVLYGVDPEQPKNCISGQKYKGSSGYRKISISKCTGGKDLAIPVERVCGEQGSGPDQVKLSTYKFPSTIEQFFYFENTGNILVKDSQHHVFFSNDEGTVWKQILKEAGDIIFILEDSIFKSRAFLITDKLVWVTNDNANSFEAISPPSIVDMTLAPIFLIPNEINRNWLIWIGAVSCSGDYHTCHSEAHVSWDGGKHWSLLTSYARSCQWGKTKLFQSVTDKTIFCSVFQKQTGNQRVLLDMELKRSDNGDQNFQSVVETNGFAIEYEYMVVAVPHKITREVTLQVSLDGVHFAVADFPSSFAVHAGYTVLDSTTGNAFIHMIQSNGFGAEYGSIVKSNWNGTFYHKVLDYVNQNRYGYVDFEKIEGLNGTMVVNQIANPIDLSKGESKRLITKMSYDDGETWNSLKPPSVDSYQQPYRCKGDCFLHLHAFTERHDKRDTYSSIGAIGVMVGVGNVGESLTDFNDGDVFVTTDAGRTWKEVQKEAHMIEIADHGAIILMVNDEEAVSSVKYSLNYGATFRTLNIEKDLGGGKMRIQNIITEPSGSTSHFVLIGRLHGNVQDTSVAIHLDFTHVWPRVCTFDEDLQKSDFEAWSPSNSTDATTCTFGQRIDFWRRKHDRECTIGDTYTQLKSVSTPCLCTAADFECDEFHRRDGEKCVPIPGLTIPQPRCINGQMKVSNGYHKKKISSCQGGLVLSPAVELCGN
ncbi:hypothetical protein BC833DRAFT_521459 [Globomyces pollinis-pini]|nr:hypothetical protein BC833DRAFT_521459 [Globomyces pollinis-pini]